MLSSTTPTYTSLLPLFGVSAWECGELTAAITRGIINNVKALIFDGLGIIIYRLSYEIFILRCPPFYFIFFWQPSYLLFLFSPVKGEACDIIYGGPFSFAFPFFFCFLFSFLNAVRYKKPYRCIICCFVFLYNSGAPKGNFRETICSEDELRTRIFGTFVVKFLACLPLLGFSNI